MKYQRYEPESSSTTEYIQRADAVLPLPGTLHPGIDVPAGTEMGRGVRTGALYAHLKRQHFAWNN